MKLRDDELQDMLDKKYGAYEEPEEDLLIYQPDGTKACLNWELAGQGFHVLDTHEEYF